MKRKPVYFTLALLSAVTLLLGAFLTGAPAALAQAPAPTATPSSAPFNSGNGPTALLNGPTVGSNLLGMNVQVQSGTEIGWVQGLVLDSRAGRVDYMVVSAGEVLNQYDVLVPWSAFSMVSNQPNQNQIPTTGYAYQLGSLYTPSLLLNVPIAAIQSAPQFNPDQLQNPAQLSANWDNASRDYWSSMVGGLPVTGTMVQSDLSDLIYVKSSIFDGINFDVEGPSGNHLGEVENFIVDANGRISFALLDPARALDAGNDLRVVAWPALRWNADSRSFTLSVPANAIHQAPTFTEQELANLPNPNYDQAWNKYWYGPNYQPSNPAGSNAGPNPQTTPNAPETTPPAQLPQNPNPASTALPGENQALGGQPFDQNIIGADVFDIGFNRIGSFADMIVGPDGQTRYGVVYDGQAYHPIPSYEFYWKHNRNAWFYIGSTQNFEQSPSYPSLDAINTSAPNWDAQIKQYWQNTTSSQSQNAQPTQTTPNAQATPNTPETTPPAQIPQNPNPASTALPGEDQALGGSPLTRISSARMSLISVSIVSAPSPI